ncbi:MAG TPA: VWA domain-containing protein [Pyrinomonadaceae bacterium]|nr:VWA domain-containing protein [Pyrinomonadaceae bacterium]
MRSVFVLLLISLAIAGIAPPQNSSAQSQSETPERRRLEDFGSSLKRLKWDPEKGTAVETVKPGGQPGTQSEGDVVRVETNLAVCNVSVRDKSGRIVEGLTQNDFLVSEDGRPQKIEHFSLGNDQRLGRSIVLVIDYSGSQSPYIKGSVAAAKILVEQLGPKDVMAIVTDDVALLVDFTRDKTKLKQALDSLVKKSEARQFGRSSQFSALMATVREMFTEEDIRPVVIFQTDGDELFCLKPSNPPLLSIPDAYLPPGSTTIAPANFSLRDLYQAIEKSRALVYTVIPGVRVTSPAKANEPEWSMSPASAPGSRIRTPLTETRSWFQLAAAGAAIGGWTSYMETPKQAPEIYRSILGDLNQRYVIGYYPTNKAHDGRQRKVVVEVRGHPEYSVTGRKSYVAAAPN